MKIIPKLSRGAGSGFVLDVGAQDLHKCFDVCHHDSSVWYILVCGLEGDEVLLETPEHSSLLH